MVKEPAFSKYFIYLETLKVSSFHITLSFRRTPDPSTPSTEVGISVLANSIGVALLNIDSAEVTIPGFCLTKIFEAETSLTNKISTHYTQKATRQLIKLIGALDIIGN